MRSIKKGDVIFSSTPFVWNKFNDCRTLYCDHCLKRCKTHPCSKCDVDCYCSEECEAEAWQMFHKYECSRLNSTSPSDLTRLISKTIIQLKYNKGEDRAEKFFDQKRKFKDLSTHEEDFTASDRTECDEERRLVEEYLGPSLLPADNIKWSQDFRRIYGAVSANMQSIIHGESQNTIGMGLYLKTSAVRHSCDPNSIATFNGTTATVTAIKDIPNCNNSDKLSLRHTDPLLTVEETKKELLKKCYVECRCCKCEDESFVATQHSINCGNVNCDYPVPVLLSTSTSETSCTLVCPQCGYNSFSSDTLEQYREILEEILEIEDYIEENDSEEFYECMIRYQKKLFRRWGGRELFHDLNLIRVRYLFHSMEVALQLNRFEDALHFGQKNLHGIRHYFGEYDCSGFYGAYLLKLAKICIHLYSLKKASFFLKEAEKYLILPYGRNHPIIKDTLRLLQKGVRNVQHSFKVPHTCNERFSHEKKFTCKVLLYWFAASAVAAGGYLGLHSICV